MGGLWYACLMYISQVQQDSAGYAGLYGIMYVRRGHVLGIQVLFVHGIFRVTVPCGSLHMERHSAKPLILKEQKRTPGNAARACFCAFCCGAYRHTYVQTRPLQKCMYVKRAMTSVLVAKYPDLSQIFEQRRTLPKCGCGTQQR